MGSRTNMTYTRHLTSFVLFLDQRIRLSTSKRNTEYSTDSSTSTERSNEGYIGRRSCYSRIIENIL
jgi:hypothetical protein